MTGKEAEFAANLRFEDIPPAVVDRAEDLFLHGSVFHPGTVVFPPVLAVAQAAGKSGRNLLTAGTLAAAAATAAGLWEFLCDAADSRQLHTAKASADGMLSPYVAQSGFAGAKQILECPQGMASGMSTDADPSKLLDRLDARLALVETSFKYHACCRHTPPAADALLQVVSNNHLVADQILRVTAKLEAQALRLAAFTGAATPEEMGSVFVRIADLRDTARVGFLLQ